MLTEHDIVTMQLDHVKTFQDDSALTGAAGAAERADSAVSKIRHVL